MKLNSKWRRYLCSNRWLGKFVPQLYKCHNAQLLVADAQHKAFIAGAGTGVLAFIALIAVMGSGRAQGVIHPIAPAPIKQAHDSDKEARGKQPIAFSDETVTITFHNCRENSKKHWSCQRIDGDNTDHYVYIPGFTPSTQRPNPLAETEEKGGSE